MSPAFTEVAIWKAIAHAASCTEALAALEEALLQASVCERVSWHDRSHPAVSDGRWRWISQSRNLLVSWERGVACLVLTPGGLDPQDVGPLLAAALDAISKVHSAARDQTNAAKLRSQPASDEVLVGADRGLAHVMQRVEMVAKQDVPVLLLGETGTGKEVIARTVHGRSPRAMKPFVRVNCGAIPSDLVDSELFGHERGGFTGALERRQGWFERADGGTLLLDEIGELPLKAQVRLLRILQDGSLTRVGGGKSLTVDVRIIAATHRDLPGMVGRAEFREDLWYRIATFPIRIPPLRERQEDIAGLARHFVHKAAIRFGLGEPDLDSISLELLQRYNWPGNIRELGAVIDRAMILGEGKRLAIDCALGLGAESAHSPQIPGAMLETKPASLNGASAERLTLDRVQYQHIEGVLRACHGRVEGPHGAAAVLGINPHTLRSRMRRLGIEWSRFRRTEADSQSDQAL